MAEEENPQEEPLADVPQSALANSTDQIRVRAEGFHQVYANNLSMAFSSWDMGITFGQILGEKDGKSVIQENVKVLLTREMAKIMLKLLSAHISAFEEQFGTIRIPVLEQPEGDTEEQMVQAVKENTRKVAVRRRK